MQRKTLCLAVFRQAMKLLWVRNCPQYHFCSPGKFSTYKAFQLINLQKKDPSFIYKESKQVCQWVRNKLQSAKSSNQNIASAINQISYLTDRVHISSFSSWKQLYLLSIEIKEFLNSDSLIHFLNSEGNLANRDGQNLAYLPKLIGILNQLNYSATRAQQEKFVQFVEQKTQLEPSLGFLSVASSQAEVVCQSQLESIVFDALKKLQTNQQMSWDTEFYISKIIKNAVYQNMWSERTLQTLTQKIDRWVSRGSRSRTGLTTCLQTLKLQHPGLYQNQSWKLKAQQSKQNVQSKTQSQLSVLLREIGYSFHSNQFMFEIEVDYLFTDRLILEFHGIHHYLINLSNREQTAKTKWKKQAFQRRNYKFYIIPFYEWNKLDTVYDKKRYVIKTLQTL